MNRFSPTETGTPVSVRANGEERDSESAAQTHDPAPADLDEEYRNLITAYERGKAARAAGWGRSALLREAFCWEAGYAGDRMPEFSGYGED